MTTQRDPYEVLGVGRGASDEDVKRAFRRLAQQWHPDVNTEPGADARFKEINEAYQVLSDPQRRQAYDMFGQAGLGSAAGGFGEGYGPFGGMQAAERWERRQRESDIEDDPAAYSEALTPLDLKRVPHMRGKMRIGNGVEKHTCR